MRTNLAIKLFLFVGGTFLLLLVLVFIVLQKNQARQWEDHLREQSISFARFATPELLKLFRGDFTLRETRDVNIVQDFLGFNPDLVEFSFYSPSGRLLFASPRFPAYIDLEDVVEDERSLQRRIQAVRPTQMTMELQQGGRLLDVLMPAFGPTGQHLVSVRYFLSYERIDRRLAEMQQGFMQLLLGVAVISLLLLWFVSRGITRPVRILTAGAQAIASGDLDTRIPVKSRDEIGDLAEAFNDMAGSLKANRGELLSAQQQIMRNERLAAIGQLAAGISHEIDNPVGVILGYAELLLEDLGDQDERHADVQAIIEECRRCKKITGGLLNLARDRDSERSEVDFAVLLASIVGSLQPQALFRYIEISLEEDPELSVCGDAEQIRQVVLNLLLNSAQAMQGEGCIKITSFKDASTGGILIHDSGPGIPREFRAKIFEPFFSTKPGGEGTGLGLAICRRLAEDQGGSLTLEPSQEGATFRLELPLFNVEKSFDNIHGDSLG